jgi:GNAT superfamily N-acetyltransferase
MKPDTSEFIITDTHRDLILYVDSLQKKNAEALSFYPKSCFEREAEKKRILLGLLNGEPCGYIYHGSLGYDMKCHQVCIQYDLRRKLYGAMLVAKLEQKANLSGAITITLRCGFDLDANNFWKSLGYFCIDIVDGGIRRNRKINVWRKYLQKDLFIPPSIEPAVGKTDASIWRKGKKAGEVNVFIRGKALQEYRVLVKERSKPQ